MNCDNNKGFKFAYIEKQNKTPTVYRIYRE